MSELTAKEKAKKQYEELRRRITHNSSFTCSTTDSNFLIWYAAMNADSCTTSSTVDHSPRYSSSHEHWPSSISNDSGSSYSDSGSSSSSCD